MPQEISKAEWIASQSASKRAELIQEIAPTEAHKAALAYHWPFWARPSQQEPIGHWTKWLALAGRGWGKTRVGAETTLRRIRRHIEAMNIDGARREIYRIAIVGQTPEDAWDVMVHGESGLLACCPPWILPLERDINESKRTIVWRDAQGNVVVKLKAYSGHNPTKLRGPQHHFAWCDEMAAWKYPEAWDQLMFGLRLGDHPQVVITTTPRPVRTIRDLIKESEEGEPTVVTTGTTYDNSANLPATFFREIINKYEGTTLGQQEIYAQVLDETPGALWKRSLISETRHTVAIPPLVRIVVAIDPAVSSTKKSDLTGIVVAGIDEAGKGYVLADASGIYTPNEWADKAIELYHLFRADRIIGEKNNGGDLVSTVINNRDDRVPVKLVHASRGKYARAEPISGLYEQRRVHHTAVFADLEDQMCNWTVDLDWSPDRMDALVWALSELMLGPRGGEGGSTATDPLAGGSAGTAGRDARGRRLPPSERVRRRGATPPGSSRADRRRSPQWHVAAAIARARTKSRSQAKTRLRTCLPSRPVPTVSQHLKSRVMTRPLRRATMRARMPLLVDQTRPRTTVQTRDFQRTNPGQTKTR